MHHLGFYPLSVAVLSGEPAVVRLILAQPGVNPDCSVACDNCNIKADKGLLIAEFSSNEMYKRIKEATPLHYACISGNSEMLKIICRFSGRFSTKDVQGNTPIDYIDCSSEEGITSLKVYSEAFDVWQKKRILFGKGESSKFKLKLAYQSLHIFCSEAGSYRRRNPQERS